MPEPNELAPQQPAPEQPTVEQPVPTNAIWERLLEGDPGTVVAMFDSLLDADLPYAAGGLLRDVAERMADAHDFCDENQQRKFREAAQMAIHHCLDGDEQSVRELMEETGQTFGQT